MTTRDHVKIPQRTRVDWSAAKARYVELGPDERTLARLSRELGVSQATVQKHARDEAWAEAARLADERAAAKALEIATRSREQRAAQTARIRDLAADRIERKLTPDETGDVAADDNTVVQAWKEADRQYRLDIGEATARIEVHEVHEFIQRVMIGYDELLVAALDEHLGNGKRSAILARVRAGAPALLEQTARGTVES